MNGKEDNYVELDEDEEMLLMSMLKSVVPKGKMSGS